MAGYDATILYVGLNRKEGLTGTDHSFEPMFLPTFKADIKVSNRADVFNSETKEAAVKAAAHSANTSVRAALGVDASASQTLVGQYHILKIVDVFRVVDELNSEANRDDLERIASFGDAARIILGTATVFGYAEDTAISASGELSVSQDAPQTNKAELSAKPSYSSTNSTKLSNGTVFAYEYARFCWQERNGSLHVHSLVIDPPGANKGCPLGSTENARALSVETQP